MGVLWWVWGFETSQRPDIVSGLRPPERQRQLLQAWNAGQRAGLRSKPACQSWHMNGKALDTDTGRDGFPAYVWLMKQWGVRWGGDFNSPSPNHFDMPTGTPPPNICQT